MTHREIVIRLAEAYIKAGQSVEADKIIKIADYFMAHTNDNSYSTGTTWMDAISKGYVSSPLYSTPMAVTNDCKVTACESAITAVKSDIPTLETLTI